MFTGREGDACLSEPEFVESHPIVYWNLVWFLERANIDNHLPDLLSPNFASKYQSTDPLPDVDKLGKYDCLFMFILIVISKTSLLNLIH